MTPEELTAAAAHSREAITALDYMRRHGGIGGMTYVMASAEDVPGLLEHIAGLEAKVANLSHALDVVQLREIRQDATITQMEAELAAAVDRDKVLTGRLVEAWHDGHGGDAPLCNYLGLTWEQYQQRFGPPPTPTDAAMDGAR